jgi:hypothetical protein
MVNLFLPGKEIKGPNKIIIRKRREKVAKWYMAAISSETSLCSTVTLPHPERLNDISWRKEELLSRVFEHEISLEKARHITTCLRKLPSLRSHFLVDRNCSSLIL